MAAITPNDLGLVLHAVLTNVDVIERHATDADPVVLLTLEAEAELIVVLCPALFAGSAQEQHLQRLVGTRVQLPLVSSPAVLMLAEGRLAKTILGG
ncbi:hypothetical protein NUK31_05520 [Aeromonas caviae]|uniref:hypothetical protein n=1 Tax=Aeromonas caviae TaxID=648 RepID=UPI00214EA6FD|nr:hypothetical protein [Aeromonas caviae]MCR3892526.1 hypothetical protein [Aeromonas caviae]